MYFIVGDYWIYWWCLVVIIDNFFNMLMVKKLKFMGLRKMYCYINYWWIILFVLFWFLSIFYVLWESDFNFSLFVGVFFIEVGFLVFCIFLIYEILVYYVCVIYFSFFVLCEFCFFSVFIVVYLNCRICY